jgi:glycosyltransferase involved in cell wall biosynthesis
MDLPVSNVSLSRIITVLGMHRSGTSAITRGLMVLGVRLGDQLHPAWIDNPKGFWEDKDCIGINEELLALLGSAYDKLDLGLQIPISDPRVLSLRVRAAELLRGKLQQGGGLWGFKDPRTCRLLPFWQPLLQATGSSLAFVICLRNPMSVARSLNKRNDIAFEKGYLLWLQHVLPVLQNTAGPWPRVVVEYDRLIAAPRSELLRIAQSLALDLGGCDSELDAYVDEFLEEDLQHNRFSAADLALDPRAPSSVVSLYEVLRRVAADELTLDAQEVAAAVAKAQEQLAVVWPALSYVNQIEADLTAAKAVLPQLKIVQSRVIELEGNRSELQENLGGVQARAAALEAELDSERLKVQEALISGQARAAALEAQLDSERLKVQEALLSGQARATALEAEMETERLTVQNALISGQARATALEAEIATERSKTEGAVSRAQAHAAFLEAELALERSARSKDQAMTERLRDELHSTQIQAARLGMNWQDECSRSIQAQDLASAAVTRLALLQTSSSWRITAPLRNALVGRPRAARLIRRSSKLIWWSVTLQLVKRLRARRRVMLTPHSMPPTDCSVTADLGSFHNLALISDCERQAALGTLLCDWLAANHNSANKRQIPLPWLDELLSYFRYLNVSDDAALLFSAILLEGFAPTMREQLNQIVSEAVEPNKYLSALVQELEGSSLFDAPDYMTRISLAGDTRQAAIHYLLLGEPLGIAPSSAFNPVYYIQRYDDLRINPCSALIHYIRYGAREERQTVERQSALGTLLCDWLAANHNSANKRQILLPWFDGLLNYFRYLNVDIDAALLFSAILLEGFGPTMREQLIQIVLEAVESNEYLSTLVQELEGSSLFDALDYMKRISLAGDARQAAMHYLLLGEPLGIAPSTGFNPVYYIQRYDDLRINPCSALIHYIRYGAREERQPVNLCSPAVLRPWATDPGRENIILTVHETSRTGAPILGWNIASRLAAIYNVFTIRLGGGPLTAEFEALSVEVHGPFSQKHPNEIDVAYGLQSLFDGRRFKYAIVNSMESRTVLRACTKAGIPTVLLVHEFSSYIWPRKALVSAYEIASEIVFPAPIVARSALDSDSAMRMRPYHIMPQGMSALPTSVELQGETKNSKLQTLAALRSNGTMIVLGAGSVDMRKGVDIFLGVASSVQRRAAARPVHFVWVGAGFRPREDLGYSLYLEEHLNRARLADHFTFVDAVTDLEPVYALADIFLLTSRLDPLPNVTIDAAMRGIPIVCFQDASGMSDLLLANSETRCGVAPHLDAAMAAEIIVQMAGDEAARQRLAEATQRYAAQIFDMDRYIDELDTLGSQATVREIVEEAPPSASAWWFDAEWYAAQYGTMRDHTGYLTEGLPAGHAPGPLAAHILARFAPETRFSAVLYGQFQRTMTWRKPIPKDSLRLVTMLYVPAWHASPGLAGFLAFLREGLVSGDKPGPLFNADVYQARAVAAGLPPIESEESTIIHWLRYGVAARIVPTTRFDEEFYRANNPDLCELPLWGFAHYIEHGAREGRRPDRRLRLYRPPLALPAAACLPSDCEAWYKDDVVDPDGCSGISVADEEQLGNMLASPWLAEIYADIQRLEPGVGGIDDITDYLLPPHNDALTTLHATLRGRLPATRYQSVICVPWIRTGGADLVAGLLAAALLRIRPTERVLIVRTDGPHFEKCADWLPDAADCIDMSDLRVAVSEPEAQKLLRVLLRGVAACRVFNVNSRLCWTTFRDNQANMAASHAYYAYLFCWDQTADGRRVGYPAEFFAETVASASSVLTDTEYLKNELTAQYRLAPQVREKIVALATPAQGIRRHVAIAREIAEAHTPIAPCVLWAGRLDRQKRFDLVCEIARLMPEVSFRCWGTAMLDAPPDLSALPANIVMEGMFQTFDDLPLTQAGAWLFTSSWEGLPTTIIELGMRGVAVVASAVGGVTELITSSTGWALLPEANAKDYTVALYAALEDPSGAAARAEALQNRVATRHSTAAYDAALARLLDQETPRD